MPQPSSLSAGVAVRGRVTLIRLQVLEVTERKCLLTLMSNHQRTSPCRWALRESGAGFAAEVAAATRRFNSTQEQWWLLEVVAAALTAWRRPVATGGTEAQEPPQVRLPVAQEGPVQRMGTTPEVVAVIPTGLIKEPEGQRVMHPTGQRVTTGTQADLGDLSAAFVEAVVAVTAVGPPEGTVDQPLPELPVVVQADPSPISPLHPASHSRL